MTRPATRRRDALSKSRIIDAAIGILDRDGEDALTFRALAEHFSTGPGALYHHIAGKEELLAAATHRVIADSLSDAPEKADPLGAMRGVALAIWDAAESHPWVGTNIYSDPTHLSAAMIYEAIGSRLPALGVPPNDQLDVCAAVGSYIVGTISQQSANARLAKTLGERGYDRTSYLKEFTRAWEALDADAFPFMHRILDQFPTHDDEAQYRAGVDLMLAGIAQRYSEK